MIDLIFIVDDTNKFHKQNMIDNAGDYTFFVRYSYILKLFQSNTVYFNPFIQYEDLTFKYGVAQRSLFEKDCLEWNQLYVAGRLQKPVLFLTELQSKDVEILKANLESAFVFSLLQLTNRRTNVIVDEIELYKIICSLSYTSDVRTKMSVEGEDKIENMVKGSFEKFQELYGEFFEKYCDRTQYGVQWKSGIDLKALEKEKVPKNAKKLDRIVFTSSLKQTVLNAVAAGFFKSAKYLFSKLNRRWR